MADHDTSSDSGSSAVTIAASLSSEFHSLPARPIPAPRRSNRPSASSRLPRRPADEVVDRILQQSRSDRMFELRKLQHGERPVTGQGHREKLEQLFAEQQESAPVNTEERRPEAILVEVHSVAEARPVQAMLQSSRFRQQLESVIRSSLTPRPPPGSSVTPSPLAGFRHRERSNSWVSIAESSSSGSLSHIGAAAPRPPRPATSDRRWRPERPTSALPRPAPPAPASAARVPQVELPARAQQVAGWLERATREAPANVDQAVWQNLEDAYRDEMIHEISELVHRQLVTSTLDSGFRNDLEGRMLQRVEASETDGARVARAIRALPRGAVARNDFSHLGIVAAALPDDVDENMSFVSAQAVPIAHTNAVMSREISGLKSQMAEMKQMLKLSFELQLDVQRAVRQEVSAALARLAPETSAESLLPVSRPVGDSHCIVCLENEADCVLYRCGHLCLCYTCGMKLQERGNKCPVCRAPIQDIVRAYKTTSQ